MSIEDLQSQLASLHARTVDLSQRAGTHRRLDHGTLVASIEEISRVAERLLAANNRVEQRLAIQYAVMRALTLSSGLKEASQKILQAICEATGAEFAALWIFDREAGQMYVENLWQVPGSGLSAFAKLSRSLKQAPTEGLPSRVYLDNTPQWIPDVSQVEFPRKQAAIKSGLRSAVLFPIRANERPIGTVECFSRGTLDSNSDLMDMLDALGNQIGAFMGRKEAEDLLAARVQQQAVVAQLGQRALVGISLQELFEEVAAQVAQTLNVGFTKILELDAAENRLLLRAGVGWMDGRIGQTYVDTGPRSQAGYSLSLNKPVAVTELSRETRFQPSPLLVEHGIVSGLSVIIPGRPQPFGILGAHSDKPRTFTEDDIHFLQAVAHVLAAAIERQEIEEALRLSRHEIAAILDGIADGITAQDGQGRMVYANDAAARMVGVSSAEELVTTSIGKIMAGFETFDENGLPLPVERFPGRQALAGQSTEPLTMRFRIKATGEERWSVVKAQPVLNESGQLVMAVNIFQDVTDLKRTELKQRLLADAAGILETSLDYQTRLASLAEILVPRLADWAAIDILDENQVLQRVAVSHIDPDKVRWAHELHRRFPPDPKAPQSLYTVVRNNQAVFIPTITAEMLEAVSDPEMKDILDRLSISSILQVPLVARGHGLGALSLTWAESGRHYSQADLMLAEELAERAALALDNARLYMEAQRLNATLEQRVTRRTLQLQKSNLRLKDEIKERLQAENQVRSLNAELEQRVTERTMQLENTNLELQHEILEREMADLALQQSLQKTRELYEISQNIGLAHEPDDVLAVLLSSSYLKSAVRASLAIFDTLWEESGDPPGCCTILAAWDRDPEASLELAREMSLADYGLLQPYTRNEPSIIFDVRTDPRLPDSLRRHLTELKVASSVIFPLIAAGQWYGLFSLHFDHIRMLNAEDVRHLRGLVDEAAMAIYNFRLLQKEAEARREAEEANNLKLKFLAMISHELRTPLTSIKGFATTLLADDVEWEPESQRDFVETIDVEADKLTDLIEQLLDLSRLEAGTMRIVARRVNWEQVLATAMAQLQTLTRDHHLVLKTEQGLPPLRVDMMRAAQVLTNLVNNAVKYSAPQSIITISVRRLSDQFLKVSIADEGLGIPQEAYTRVFEAFQQLDRGKGEGSLQGAGLGLAICRGLVEAHGGQIWVDEHEGVGTTISFTLPIDQEPVTARR